MAIHFVYVTVYVTAGNNNNIMRIFSLQIIYIYEINFLMISALEKKCPVCLGVFDEEDELKEMPCSHKFHSKCILPWLEKV